jgi:hypothetical protein
MPIAGTAAAWSPPTDINYGDERADARALPEFSDGWQRRAIQLNTGYLALGLVLGASSEAVIELDNRARPVRVSEAAAGIIGRLEDSWPDAALTGGDLAVLAREDHVVRYLLADRLVAEGDPPPELFHILPWELVTQLAGQLTDMLAGAAAPTAVIVLGHWFTSAGSRFTAALEQLDEGLRDQDLLLARIAATALCARLLDQAPARLPAPTRTALGRLAVSLDRVDPFLRFAARRAAARLVPGADAGEARAPRLSTRLAAAADTAAGVRTESRDTVRDPFVLQLMVTATGRAEVVVSAPLPPDLRDRVDYTYAVMLLPVRITGEQAATRYLVPLRRSGGQLTGRLDLPVPVGRFVEADIDGPPIGAAETAFLRPDEVRFSIRGLRTRSGRAPWSQIAELLPTAHPLREVIAGEVA